MDPALSACVRTRLPLDLAPTLHLTPRPCLDAPLAERLATDAALPRTGVLLRKDRGYQMDEIEDRGRGARADMEEEIDAAQLPVGTLVRYWRGAKRGEPSGMGRTRSVVMERGNTPVVWIDGTTGCIAMSHVEVVSDAPGEGS